MCKAGVLQSFRGQGLAEGCSTTIDSDHTGQVGGKGLRMPSVLKQESF